MSFTTLVRFFLRHWNIFGSIVNLIVFLISLSASSLLLSKNAMDFCTFIWYPATLRNLFVSSSRFLVKSFKFSIYSNLSSANSESFTSSLLIWIPFISFCCLIAVARTSSTMLDNSSEHRRLCLIPDFMGKALSFLPLSMILIVGFSYGLYYVEICSL